MQNEKKLDIIRRIQGAGYLREVDTALRLNIPKLTIDLNPLHSALFDFCGGTGVILELQITSDRPVLVQEFGDLKLRERPYNMAWWVLEKSHVYQFRRGPEYPRDAVLNHRIGEHGMVKPGQPLEGVLMGRSATGIPLQCSQGFQLPLTFSILDASQSVHRVEFLVPVDLNLCRKIRRPTRSLLYGPCASSEPVRAIGVAGSEQYQNVPFKSVGADYVTKRERRSVSSGDLSLCCPR